MSKKITTPELQAFIDRFHKLESAKKGFKPVKSIKIGLGNMCCVNCEKPIPARISKCCYCDHVYYNVSPHTAKHGNYTTYHNVMTPNEQIESLLERTGYEFDSLTKKKFVSEIKKGNISLSGRKLVMSLEAITNILAD